METPNPPANSILKGLALPNMGIKVVRPSVGCPKQNGVVERFNRTLTEELLNHIIPLGALHINGLLKQYQTFYNTARPHRAIPWLSGLHHSYRRVA